MTTMIARGCRLRALRLMRRPVRFRRFATQALYPPLSQAPTLDAEWYRSPQQYELERGRIFWTQWHCVGASGQISSPREYITETIAGWPIIVQRAREEKELSKDSPPTTLRAFHNLCRHRAGPLALPQDTPTLNEKQPNCGKSPINGFKCRYHGWTYAESGELKGTPHFNDKWPEDTPAEQKEESQRTTCSQCSPPALDPFDKADLGLYPIEVREEMGLIFVRLHSEKAIEKGLKPPLPLETAQKIVVPFETAYEDMMTYLKDANLEEYQFYSSEIHELECNWKTYVDNYSEGYHIFVCHPDLNDDISAQGDYRVEVSPSGRSMRHVVPLREDAASASTGIWVFSYPNLAVNVYGNGLSIERMVPLTPTRMAIKYLYMFKPGTSQEEIDLSIAGSAQLTLEDKEIAEQVQANLSAGIYTASRYSPRHENGTYAFHKAVWQACNV